MILRRHGACRAFQDAVWEDRETILRKRSVLSTKTIIIIISVTTGSPHPADPLRAAKVYCYMYAVADRTERQEIPQRGGVGGCASVTRGKSSCQNPFCSRNPSTPLRFNPPPRRNALQAGESSLYPLTRTRTHTSAGRPTSSRLLHAAKPPTLATIRRPDPLAVVRSRVRLLLIVVLFRSRGIFELSLFMRTSRGGGGGV